MIKTFIFDFDGTIANTLQLVFEVFNELSDKYKYPKIQPSDVDNLRNLGAKEFIKALKINPLHILKFANDVQQKEASKIAESSVFPYMLETLNELKHTNRSLGIITSNSRENVMSFLEGNSINIFDFVISENDLFGKSKIIKRVTQEKKLNPSETAYVGDEDRDIEAALSAGVTAVGVTWGYNSEKLLKTKNPNYLISSPKELLEIK